MQLKKKLSMKLKPNKGANAHHDRAAAIIRPQSVIQPTKILRKVAHARPLSQDFTSGWRKVATKDADGAELRVDDNKIEILPVIESFPTSGEGLESPIKMRPR